MKPCWEGNRKGCPFRVYLDHDMAFMRYRGRVEWVGEFMEFLIDEMNCTPQYLDAMVQQGLDYIEAKVERQHGISGKNHQANAGYSNQALAGGLGGGPGLSLQQQALQQYLQKASQSLLNYTPFTGEDEIKATPVKLSDIKVGEVIAWRGWRMVKGYLRSISQDVIWGPKEVMEGKVDSKTHGEGIYAFKSHSHLLSFLNKETKSLGLKDIVTGEIALWGDIVEHELGYRAQFGKIVSLSDTPEQKFNRLREFYGVGEPE